MSLSKTLKRDLKEALKSRDSLKVSVFRMLLSSLHEKEIEKIRDLSEDEEIEVLSAEAKKRREAIEAYRQGGREDLAEKEKRELRIIEGYLPERMSSEELEDLVRKVVSEVGAASPSDLGRVMGAVMPKVGGRAEGAEVRKVVEEVLR